MEKSLPQNESKGIPAWLNITLVFFIFVTLLFGAKVFLTEFDQTARTYNYEAFIPSALCTCLYFLILFMSSLFSNADFATIMMVTLLICGFVVLGIGFISKDESTKSTAFNFASPILGLAFGIPFGDKLRAPSRRSTNMK